MHVLTCTEKIRRACDPVQFACGVFLDLQKAVDTVNHNILLRKLENYETRAVSNIWFQLFLTNRKHHIYHAGIISMINLLIMGFHKGLF